jgi:hypothetical protein
MFVQELGSSKGSDGALIVHHVSATAGKFVLACLIVLAFTAPASVGMGVDVGPLRSANPSPAEIIASRFPSVDAGAVVVPATFSTARIMPVEHWEMSNGGTSYPLIAADPAWPAAGETTEPPVSEPAPQPAAIVETVKPEPPRAPAANAAPRRLAGRSGAVLNDAQIASIKRRLNLTTDQQRMWPAVEAALRKITYTKNAMNPQAYSAQSSGAHMAYIDPSTPEVQELKNAALPLITRLNDEQKREVKMLAYVMGLEAVASQF